MPKLLNVLAKVSDLCRRRGFVIDRYLSRTDCLKDSDTTDQKDGSGDVFDYGPLGVEVKRNVSNEWWYEIVTCRDNIHGLDLSMIQPVQENLKPRIILEPQDSLRPGHAADYFNQTCRHAFNFMETCGFKIPFGLAQRVKLVTTGNDDINYFMFRSYQKEFLKLCFFCPPNKLNFWIDYWMRKRLSWWKKYADMPAGFSLMESSCTKLFGLESNSFLTDSMAVEFDFPWGKEAIECISGYSNIQELLKMDVANTEQLSVVMATASVEKGILAYLLDAFHERERTNSQGVVTKYNTLRLHPVLAPVKVAVLSSNLLNNDLCRVAQQLAAELRQAGIATSYVEDQNFDECYSKQDEVGTPYCVTVQDSTLTNGIVTLRNRDTTLSEFLHISEILKTVQRHLDSY